MAGGEAHQLTAIPRGAGAPVWSPDGSFLVYAGPQVGTSFRLQAMTNEGHPHSIPEMNLEQAIELVLVSHTAGHTDSITKAR